MRARHTLLLAALLAIFSVSCRVRPGGSSNLATSPHTGYTLAVDPAPGAHYDHPVKLSQQQVLRALESTGRIKMAEDARFFAPHVAKALATLTPEQSLALHADDTVVTFYVSNQELHFVERFDGTEVGRGSYPMRTTTALAMPNSPTGAAAPAAAVAQPLAAAPQQGVPRIWTIAVGVSRYQENSISLKYAARDAVAVDSFFGSQSKPNVPQERRTLLTDEKASREAILTAITTVAKRSAPEDLIVIFLAMHGLPDAGGDLYFLAHDTMPNRLVGTGLPQRDIQYSLEKAQAKRVVLLIDACHAGAVGMGRGLGQSRGLELAETNRLLDRLSATRPGIAVLTASSASESSYESQKWGGHGAFSHYLLKGLTGGADSNADGFVTIRELYDFTYSHVSRDTSGNQHPELKGQFDNAMPLSTP